MAAGAATPAAAAYGSSHPGGGNTFRGTERLLIVSFVNKEVVKATVFQRFSTGALHCLSVQ